jgi:hypothetical protein
LLQDAFEALDNPIISPQLIRVWFSAQLLRLAGHNPGLQVDDLGQKLELRQNYVFNFDRMAFKSVDSGALTANHIKLLRLLFSANQPHVLAQVQGGEAVLSDLDPIVQTMLKTQIRI